MSSSSFQCRGIRREEGFDDDAAAIFGSIQRADEILTSVEFVLARMPITYSTLATSGDPKVYALKSRPSPAWPAVTIFYLCDDEFVTLLAIRRSTGYAGDA